MGELGKSIYRDRDEVRNKVYLEKRFFCIVVLDRWARVLGGSMEELREKSPTNYI
jgi:hypothetical protein